MFAVAPTHPPPRPSRQREGRESPSAVRLAGQKTLGRQAFGERGWPGARVKAKPFGWPLASLDPVTRPSVKHRCRTIRRLSSSTQNDEEPCWSMSVISQFDGVMITILDVVRLRVAATVWAGIPGGNVA